MCGRISLTKQTGYKRETPKVRLRFMFHYRTFRETRPELLHSSTALRALESAAPGCNKSRTPADKASITLTVLDDEGKCCRMQPCAAK